MGVFVNAHPLVVSETMAELKLDRVQLHGDEIPASWTWLRPEQIIRAIRVRDEASLKDALGWEASLFLYDALCRGVWRQRQDERRGRSWQRARGGRS